MKSFIAIGPSTWLLFAGLVVVCTSPVWGVAYFVNQDGSGHVQSAYLMGELLRGNAAVAEVYSLNALCVPNSSVHLVLAVLVQMFSAFTATKIVVCGLFAGVVGAAGWFRFATVGTDGLRTSLLLGAAIGFNWLWLVGNYNFMLSVIVLAITLGFYWNWRENLSLRRIVILFLLLAAAYFSHIIGFVILAGSMVVLAMWSPREFRYRALARTIPCFLPFLPLVIWYRAITDDGSPATPVWRSLADPYSISSWLTQIRSADAFLLLSRTAFPFVEARKAGFVLFWPAFWIVVAVAALLFVAARKVDPTRLFSNRYFPFAALLIISIVAAMFAPDDFGLTRGGIIRERIVICGLMFAVPLLRTATANTLLKRAAQLALVAVILFQTAAVWDYAIRSDRSAKEFVSARNAISSLNSIATVTVYAEHPQFHSTPEAQLNLYNSIGNGPLAWDNYEFGHFLFPVRMKNKADKDYAFQLTTCNVFYADDPDPVFAERLERLDAALANDGGRIDGLLVWGGRADVDTVVAKYFEPEPHFQSEHLRLFHRRKQ